MRIARHIIENALDDGRLFCKSPDGWWAARRRTATLVLSEDDWLISVAWKKRCKGVIATTNDHCNAEWMIDLGNGETLTSAWIRQHDAMHDAAQAAARWNKAVDALIERELKGGK